MPSPASTTVPTLVVETDAAESPDLILQNGCNFFCAYCQTYLFQLAG